MEIDGEERDLLRSLLSGKKPGWAVKCTVGGILQITDECAGNMTTAIRNLRGSGKVEAEFEAKGETEAFDGEVDECTASKEKRTRRRTNHLRRTPQIWSIKSLLGLS
jgi:hypothetical protein